MARDEREERKGQRLLPSGSGKSAGSAEGVVTKTGAPASRRPAPRALPAGRESLLLPRPASEDIPAGGRGAPGSRPLFLLGEGFEDFLGPDPSWEPFSGSPAPGDPPVEEPEEPEEAEEGPAEPEEEPEEEPEVVDGDWTPIDDGASEGAEPVRPREEPRPRPEPPRPRPAPRPEAAQRPWAKTILVAAIVVVGGWYLLGDPKGERPSEEDGENALHPGGNVEAVFSALGREATMSCTPLDAKGATFRVCERGTEARLDIQISEGSLPKIPSTLEKVGGESGQLQFKVPGIGNKGTHALKGARVPVHAISWDTTGVVIVRLVSSEVHHSTTRDGRVVTIRFW